MKHRRHNHKLVLSLKNIKDIVDDSSKQLRFPFRDIDHYLNILKAWTWTIDWF